MKLFNRELKKKYKALFKITITKKIIFLYIFLLISTVLITSVSSYFYFQNFIDNQMSSLDLDTHVIRNKLEKLYDENKNINIFELPDLSEKHDKKLENANIKLFLETIEKDYPDYNFKIETIEGIIEYKEKPRLIYDNKESKYIFEITRQIQFTENLPFKLLKLSLKLNYYQIILKSLLFGAFVTIFIIMVPLIIFVSRTFIRPIISISKGTQQIASGNLGILVKSYSKDELGELAKTFNYMSKELHKMKIIRDDLLAVISHELRSPLARIKGYTELLNDLNLNKKDKTVYYNSIFNEIDFLNYMVGEIIEISRLELNKEQLFLDKVDLVDLLESIQRELNLSAPIKGNIQYNFEYDSQLYCNIDIDKIKRVFLNVIENSIKADATEISIIAKKDQKFIHIQVIDNGGGIPEDQLEIVFEKFYRVDKSRDRKTGGFGLGLAICKGIIKEHQGNIYFVNREKGAELHILLPLLKEE